MTNRPPEFDERAHPQAALVFGRRRYALDKMGKNLLLLGSVVGFVFACSSQIMDLLGRRVIDRDAVGIDSVGAIGMTALKQSKVNEAKLDSMAASVSLRVSRVEDAVQMLAEIKCKELRDSRAPYLPPTCTKIMQSGRFVP